MAISRMQQPRQMYGLGSFVKKAVRKVTKPFTKVAKKIVPKEVAGIMRVAAPFLPPGYREAAYLLGTAKQTGRISPIDLALAAAPTIGKIETSTGQTVGQRLGSIKVPFTGEEGKSLKEVLVGGQKFGEFGDVTPTKGILGQGGEMFQLGKGVLPGTGAKQNFGVLDTKAGQFLLGGDEGKFSKSKIAGLGVGVLSLIQNSKTPDEAGQALAASTGNSDDYERGYQLFSQLTPELFEVPEQFRMNVKNGGIMRTNYSKGSDFITKRPNFFKDLFLEREGGGGRDFMLPMEASKRKDLTEGMIFGANDMAKAEELEAEKILPSLYTQAMTVIDAIQDIDDEETKMKMINDVNKSFDMTRGSGLSKAANSYYRIIQKYGYLLDKPEGLGSMMPRKTTKADGGIMRTDYARGTGDKGVVNPFQPKPQGPVLPEEDKPFKPKPLKPIKMAEFDLKDYMEEFERVFPEMIEKRGTQEYMDMLEDYFRGLASKDREGIMMAGSLGDEKDDISKEMFGKPVKDLNPSELEELMEELERLREKFRAAKGGRANLALGTKPTPEESGLGGLPIEADMRYTGGFMPYGAKEKADDVPARLSKNEFVFTADAVRAAGGGSVNEGAKKMYATMKQLEAKPEAKGMTA
jgi:hypothetical protein